MSTIDEMLALAKKTIVYAYSPYSDFPVTCIIRSSLNNFFCGVNVENASYPEGMCAEASAISSMVSAGETNITEVLVLAKKDVTCFPCGGCRQRLAEFSKAETLVHVANEVSGYLETRTMAELFPHRFTFHR